MRVTPLLTTIATVGLIVTAAQAQTAAGTNTPANTAPANTAPASAPVAPGAAVESTPPPYPTSPDNLVVPPGPPPPLEPPAPAPYAGAPVAPTQGDYYGPPPPSPAPSHDRRLPPRYRYIEGTPLPEGYHLETRSNRGLVFGGAAMVGIPYLIGTFGTLSVLGDGNTGWLAIPVVGPWLTLANRDTSCGEIGEPSPGGFECFSDEVGNGLLIASGIMQALGTVMIAFGVANTREYAVADYANLHITPVATPNGNYGLVVSGAL